MKGSQQLWKMDGCVSSFCAAFPRLPGAAPHPHPLTLCNPPLGSHCNLCHSAAKRASR